MGLICFQKIAYGTDLFLGVPAGILLDCACGVHINFGWAAEPDENCAIFETRWDHAAFSWLATSLANMLFLIFLRFEGTCKTFLNRHMKMRICQNRGHRICCLSCVEKIKATHSLLKFEWSFLSWASSKTAYRDYEHFCLFLFSL